MALLLAGLPLEVPGATINRLCGSGLDAIVTAARAIRRGEADADDRRRRGEHEPRAPFVMPKADEAFSRAAKIEDTTIGWRFVNPLMKAKYGIDSMPETAENVAAEFGIEPRRPGCASRCAASSAPRGDAAGCSTRRSRR